MTRPVLTSVGNPALNAAMFAPWLSIVIFLGLLYAMSWLFRPSLAFTLAFVPTLTLLLAYYLTTDKLLDRLMLILFY